MRLVRFMLPALVFTFVATAAQAQINSPPPALQGQASHHLWSVPGAIRTDIGTFFACTNTTDNPIRVGVEVFGPAGGAAANDPSATSLNVAAGGTVLFGTGLAVGLFPDSNLGAPPLSTGSARILATAGSGVICSAFLADANNSPPTSMTKLTVVKKTKQKGQ